MAILNDVKVALRIAATTTAFDGEVGDLIEAAKDDLQLAGIISDDTTDPLIKRAVITYCKAYFGYDNPDADRFIKAYEMLKMHLTLAEGYVTYAITFTVTCGATKIDGATIAITIDGIDVAELITNSDGVAVYRTTRKEVDIDYKVIAAGYVAAEGSVYVDGQETEAVSLIAT